MRAVRVAWVLAMVLTIGGCVSQPDEKDAATSLRSARATILAAVDRVAPLLATGTGRATDGRGSWVSCGSSPTDAIEYRAGGKISGDDAPISDRIRAASATLQQAGWKQTDAGEDPYAFANLEKDGLLLKLRPDALRGGDAMSFGVSGQCVRTAKGQDADFSGSEQLDLGGSAG